MNGWGKVGLFAGGVLFGTVGIKLLTSKDAKKVYTHTTAAVLRGKKCVMDTVSKVQENCGDIYADAKAINEDRQNKEDASVIADADDDGAEVAGA